MAVPAAPTSTLDDMVDKARCNTRVSSQSDKFSISACTGHMALMSKARLQILLEEGRTTSPFSCPGEVNRTEDLSVIGMKLKNASVFRRRLL